MCKGPKSNIALTQKFSSFLISRNVLVTTNLDSTVCKAVLFACCVLKQLAMCLNLCKSLVL